MDDLIYNRTEQMIARVKSGDLHTEFYTADDEQFITADDAEFLVFDTELDHAWLNYWDLNRIETWTQYLADHLYSYGYSVLVKVKANWAVTDFPARAEVDRIRRNIDALQTGFYRLPDWQEIVYNNTMDYRQTNALEWDLQTIYIWLQRAIANFDFLRSGEIYSGEV